MTSYSILSLHFLLLLLFLILTFFNNIHPITNQLVSTTNYFSYPTSYFKNLTESSQYCTYGYAYINTNANPPTNTTNTTPSCQSCISLHDPNCETCTKNKCTYCNKKYILNTSYNTCLTCSQAISNKICYSDCSNKQCNICMVYIRRDDKLIKSCIPSINIICIISYVAWGLFVLFCIMSFIQWFIKWKRKRMSNNPNNYNKEIHPEICSICESKDILDKNEYITNCLGYLCKKCYCIVSNTCNSGNYIKCRFCFVMVICFIDRIKKTEKEYKKIIKDVNVVVNNDSSVNSSVNSNSYIPVRRNNYFTNINNEVNGNNNSINSNSNSNPCSICLKENPNAVIPCQNKPYHKLHKYCLVEYITKYSRCCLCKTSLGIV